MSLVAVAVAGVAASTTVAVSAFGGDGLTRTSTGTT
jgi:hypothetical protein